MNTRNILPAPGTQATTTNDGRYDITRWTTAKGLTVAAMPNEFGDWDIWTETLVEVEDQPEGELETGCIGGDVDWVTGTELEAILAGKVIKLGD